MGYYISNRSEWIRPGISMTFFKKAHISPPLVQCPDSAVQVMENAKLTVTWLGHLDKNVIQK